VPPATSSLRRATSHEPPDQRRSSAWRLCERAGALRLDAASEPGRVHYPAGLSRREVEVLRLVAAGKGNREIAERLFVSHNTVANHVRSILTKTNTANRTEAATFAVQHELLGK